MIWIEIAAVLVLILLNGYLAASELAIVSARKPRLQTLADSGVPGAAAALALAEDPGRFLSTVQVGLTLISIFVGTFSGATIAARFAAYLLELGVSRGYAEALAVGAVVAAATYLTLIFGELVPKQIALKRADVIAVAVARPMALLSRIGAPLVTLLDASSRLGLRIVGAHRDPKSTVTDEEIKTMVAEAESAGLMEPAEKEMISGVMRLADRSVKAVMTPRRDVEWIDLNEEDSDIRARIRSASHSRLPVGRGGFDNVIGIVKAKDLLAAYLDGGVPQVQDHIRQSPVVPDTAYALDVLETLKKSSAHMALVVDEFGTFEEIVTTYDMLEAIAGELSPTPADPPSAAQRDDGSWLFDGSLPVDEMAEDLGLQLPEERDYHTVAGYVLNQFGHVPTVGEHVTAEGWRFEIVDMDGRRIDKILAQRSEPVPETKAE